MAAQQQQIAGLYAKISLQMREALNGLRDFRGRLGQATNNLKTMRDQAKISGAAVTALLTAPLALLGKTSIEMIADYQKSMNVFQLVTKASADQLAEARAAIEAVAHDLALPQFTKADAAGALLELAKAGLGAKGAIEALRPALLLAGAGEVAATEGAQLLGAALRTWGLSAEKAGATADLLAATMKFSGVSFGELRNAIEIAGSAFAQAGVPADVFLTLIGQLGQAGIKGSEAGTAVRNMLLSLVAPTEQASGLLRGLGIHVYDAQNKMKPWPAILQELQDAFARLTPAQQEQYAATIFGQEAMGAALAIIKGGLPAYDAMHDKVTTVGIAQELATVKAAGLGGATADLSREVQNASSSAFAPMADDLATLAHGLADVLRWFQALPEPVREIVGVLALLLPVVAALQLAWVALTPAINLVILAAGGLATVAEFLGGVLAVTLFGGIGAVLLPLAALAAALVIAYNTIPPFHDAVDALWATITAFGRDVEAAVGGLTTAFQHLSGVRVDFAAIIQGVPIVREIMAIWENLKRLGLVGGGGSSGGGTWNGTGPAPRVVTIGGGGSVPAMAGGGSVLGGNPYWVGEHGPEMFVPRSSGAIVPNGAGGGTYNVNYYGPVFGFSDVKDMLARAVAELKAESRI